MTTPKTRLERTFDAEAIRQLKSASPTDISIGGPTLAAAAFADDLVDEVNLYLHPIAVGGGNAALPPGQRILLALVDQHRFEGSGVMHMHYRVL